VLTRLQRGEKPEDNPKDHAGFGAEGNSVRHSIDTVGQKSQKEAEDKPRLVPSAQRGNAGPHGGAVVALDPSGRSRPIATFPEGPDPIAPIPKLQRSTGSTGAASPGLYVNDDKTGYTYMAPAASVARYAGDVIVGTESPRGLFWILKPGGKGFAEIPLRDNLAAGTSLEQAIFVS